MDNFNRYSHPSGTFDKRVVSFLINGEYRVILKTRVLPPLAVPAQADLKCQAFDKADLDDRSCMINLKGSAVYDPDEENERPSSFLIIPSE